MAGLLVDIGGTSARFALATGTGRYGAPVVLNCDDFSGLADVLAAGIAKLKARDVASAAIAVAAPVTGDMVYMTNRPWSFSLKKIAGEFGFERLRVVNDFEALAWALPYLGEDEATPIGPPIEAVANGTRGVIGPGTGLGMSGLIAGPAGYAVIAGEGGHGDFAPFNARHVAVLAALWASHDHVSWERIVSGPGLVETYGILAALTDRPAPLETPEQILAPGAPAPADEAIAFFTQALGAAAGNLALMLGARGGIFVTGGVALALGDRLDSAAFREAFEAKGRFRRYMRQIPTYLVVSKTPALAGLAAIVFQDETLSSP